ncbi:glycosyltransferase family 2 protein [Litorilituus lipolyticus]|uniref:Glycosyltransferase family 2 protein n=1 Tax=Litorilituus lipolyticus TaxID=2491017 RepID=A0A502L599_9GAMM|nr:glycosyltransferase family 2 protein [Litorilituus lipolyticus]
MCIVIPAMNEEKTIAVIVRSVLMLGYGIIVIDDASVDSTAIVAEEAGATVLRNIQNIGAWKSTQAGLRYAEQLGFDVVVTMDADGQHNAENISILINEHKKGADVVIGNCTERGSASRHLAWSFFKYINRLNVSDITSGFRLYSAKALPCLISPQATMFEYQCIGVLLMMRNMELKIVETSVPMNKRETGISRIFHSWFAVAYYLAYSGLLSLAKAFPTNKSKYIKRITRLKDIE